MYSCKSVVLACIAAAIVMAMPTLDINLQPLNFPDEFVAMISKRKTNLPVNCPASPNSCGVITFGDARYVLFGQGTCMQLRGNVQSIYVSKCYCSLWSTCTGDARRDTFVAGMMMCEKPRPVDTFDKRVKYISCGGMN